MPHVSIKMYPGRNDKTKEDLSKKMEKFIVKELGCDPSQVSVSFKEIEPDEFKSTLKEEIRDEDVYIHSKLV